MTDFDETDIMLIELYKDSIRECVQYGYYQEALDSFKVVMQDNPDLGLEIYWDMIGFWQECYDMTVNISSRTRRVISFTPKSMIEKIEENFE